MHTLTYSHLQELTDPKEILNTYFSGLVARNEEKYGSYVRGIKYLMPIIMRYPRMLSGGHKILPLMYAACRIVDDVIDGDIPYPGDVATYTQERLAFLEQIASGSEVKIEAPEDKLFAQMFDIAEKNHVKKKIASATTDIVRSMSFDAERIQAYRDSSGELVFPDHRKLQRHFTHLDVIGTGLGMVTLLRLEGVNNIYYHLDNMGSACRIEYNLTDLVEDLQQGIVNISAQDAIRYGITPQDLIAIRDLRAIKPPDPKNPSLILYQDTQEYPEGIQNWVRDEIQRYHNKMNSITPADFKSFPMRGQLFLRYAYQKPSNTAISRLTQQFTTHA